MPGVEPREGIRVTVLGSGSFGTALGTILARAGCDVVILARNVEHVRAINEEHRNPRAFPDSVLPPNLAATSDPAAALRGAAFIVHTVPVQHSFEYLQRLAPHVPPSAVFIVCSKGLHAERGVLMHELLPLALGRSDEESPFLTVLSGPTFAAGLMNADPSGAVVGSRDIALARRVAALFDTEVFRPFVSEDLAGVELAGALKNVYALAAGAAEGIGYGANTTALLVTRAVAEMSSLATALGSTGPTLAGLAGVGDLMLTCWGTSSRNKAVGIRLGKGETLADILASMTEVAEGVATAPAALMLAAKAGVRVPIIQAVVDTLDGRSTCAEAMAALLAIPTGREGIRLASH
jgi:glycerol-3-phosphate dehydrogenase (NAD+)